VLQTKFTAIDDILEAVFADVRFCPQLCQHDINFCREGIGVKPYMVFSFCHHISCNPSQQVFPGDVGFFL